MKFLETFKKNLQRNMAANPEMYRKSFDETYKAMSDALRLNNYHIGTTIKETCRELGVKPTFKAIAERLKQDAAGE